MAKKVYIVLWSNGAFNSDNYEESLLSVALDETKAKEEVRRLVKDHEQTRHDNGEWFEDDLYCLNEKNDYGFDYYPIDLID